MELLERQLAENPEDEDTLSLLARKYYAGTYDQRENDWAHRQYAHRNLQKSQELHQRIQELTPEPEVEEALRTVNSADR